MTTGQPIKVPSDRNKYDNEFMESLQLQIDLNQRNLEANRLYKETGQLPASTQMRDNRSNEEKLADVEYLKQQIISDLKPIAEPMFASAVIQGVINSPLNIDNSLFRYLAQNAQTFAQTLSKKYKFGIAGDANDVAIMVQFLEDAYNKTQNSFQSIKGYINSNTNLDNSRRSNTLSVNDTDNIISELKDILKKIEYSQVLFIQDRERIDRILANLQGRLPNPDVMREIQNYNNELEQLDDYSQNIEIVKRILSEIITFLPTSQQMSEVMQEIQANTSGLISANIDLVRQGGQQLYDLEPIDEELYNRTFTLLKELPRLQSLQTLADRLDKAIGKNDKRLIALTIDGMLELFSRFYSTEYQETLIDFRDSFLRRANDNIQRQDRENSINYVNQLRINNDAERAERKAQRVYVVNPANDPVNVIGQMNLGGGGGGGDSDISSLTGSTDYSGFNTYNSGSSPDSGFLNMFERGSSDSGFSAPRSGIGSSQPGSIYSQPLSSQQGSNYSQPPFYASPPGSAISSSQPGSVFGDVDLDDIPSAINHYNFIADQHAQKYYNDPNGYAQAMGRLNGVYPELNGLNVLRDPDNHPLNRARYPINPIANEPGSPASIIASSPRSSSSSSAESIKTFKDVPLSHPNLGSTNPVANVPIDVPIDVPTVKAKQGPGRYADMPRDISDAITTHYEDLKKEVIQARANKNEQKAVDLENAFYDEIGRTIQAVNEALDSQRESLLTKQERGQVGRYLTDLENGYDAFSNNEHKINIITAMMPDLLRLKKTSGYNQLLGHRKIGKGLKRVKKGRGLYSPFGDSEINHKNLENNILTIRRKTKSNYMDLPSKHISKHMKNIIHNIVGGKIADYEDIHNLNDEERNYLNKVISKSNLQDRLSVPAPSKDQAEKDNHQWEVMRGEIMAGNDSHELVKKFKLLTMKLTRQGLLPKNEVMDLFEDLVSLGY